MLAHGALGVWHKTASVFQQDLIRLSTSLISPHCQFGEGWLASKDLPEEPDTESGKWTCSRIPHEMRVYLNAEKQI